MKHDEVLRGLNDAQRRAVETTDGPVLVIAGPGTGKTQLLTTRAAHILQTTDTLPHNILCLTFTDAAAHTMRERLSGMIGQDAYSVTMTTYHSFGSDIIRRYPDYFAELGELQPVDELGTDQILREIIAALPFSNPLKFADVYLRDIKAFISDAKRAVLSPDDIEEIAQHNDAFLQKAQPVVAEVLAGMARIDKKAPERFTRLAERLAAVAGTTQPHEHVLPLSMLLLRELHTALAEAQETGKTTPLTAWKNDWLAKDADGIFVVDGEKANQKLRAAAGIYRQYSAQLRARELYDYDDMILHAVNVLEKNADLRYTLQEQYLYIMLDEFQDTNEAQLRLMELLTDNPASEGRPNVLAVGDDDQAIYAFQGADYSHMLRFKDMYRDVAVIPLTQNYRSHADVLHVAQGLAGQIEERLHHRFPDIDKTLTPMRKGRTLAQTKIERREAKSDVAQFAWVAQQIKKLTEQGVPASEIAVLAPKHKYLEPLVPFLHQQNLPLRYEKRENVLDDPVINQLVRMSELCLALGGGRNQTANALWAEILSFDFWRLPTSLVWQLSWQASDDRENWTDVLLQNEQLKPIVLFFIRLSLNSGTETLETMLDYLIGTTPLDLQEPGYNNFTSPFYEHHFGQGAILSASGESTVAEPDSEGRDSRLDLQNHARERSPEAESMASKQTVTFWQVLTNLTVLRTRLREHAKRGSEPLKLQDFIGFVEAHRNAGIKILNTSPYQEADDAVQLMTAYKAKGQEFAAVFLLACNDEGWGGKSRGSGARLSLPHNLRFIRYAGATDDERLRLLFVAATRAKSQLYLANYQNTYAGKPTTRLKYLNETTDEQSIARSPLLPENSQEILRAEDGGMAPASEQLIAYWQQRHQAALSQQDLCALLQERLAYFQLSPTHVNVFTDISAHGPQFFFMDTLLRFPRAPTPSASFGSAMHETLEWIHVQSRRQGSVPSKTAAHNYFEHRLRDKSMSEQDTAQYLERGHVALTAYLSQRANTINAANEHEFNFRNEGVFIGNAHMGGKIDKLIINKQAKTITIVDFKTGRSHHAWRKDTRMHRYRQQLYLYKALVEGSRTFKGYRVIGAYLEFVEPDEQGNIHELHLQFDQNQEQHIRKLAQAVWHRIKTLDLPVTSQYTPDLRGIEDFEQSLLK